MSSESQPLVSVVTPVYNTEKYLAECIESVLAQTYQNWEYVIVNNCSTDRSLEIAQQYARQDDRIRIYNNEQFLSQMQNWNHAMRQISPESKYCKVVHADDWLFPECIARMVEVAEANPSIGIVSAYRLDEDQVNLDGLPYPSTFIPGREIGRLSLLGGPFVFGSPTSLLIRSDLIRARATFYNEHNIHADEEVCYDILQQADFGFVHQVLTYTRRHNETTTTFIRRLRTYALGRLTALKKYGPVYLSQAEYEKRLKQAIESYYKFLSKNVFELREREFWDYHRQELANLEISFSLVKLIKATLFQFLYPVNTVGLIKRGLQRRRGQEEPRVIKKSTIVSSPGR